MALTRVKRGTTRCCLRGVTLISVVALIFTGLNKGRRGRGLHVGRVSPRRCSFRPDPAIAGGGRSLSLSLLAWSTTSCIKPVYYYVSIYRRTVDVKLYVNNGNLA